MKLDSNWKKLLAGGLLLFTLGALVAVYGRAMNAPFTVDARTDILQNPSILSLSRLDRVFSPPSHVGTAGRPLANLTFALNWAAGKDRIFGYHFVNLVLHALAGFLVFSILLKSLGSGPMKEQVRLAWIPALAGALIFLFHPIQTGTVVPAFRRPELLMAVFFLASLLFFITSLTARNRAAWQGAAVGAFVLGTGSKEVIVAAPVVLWAWNRVFEKRDLRWAFLPVLLPGLVLGLIILALVVFSSNAIGRATESSPFTFGAYLSGQPAAVLHYLRLVLDWRGLCFDPAWEPEALSRSWPMALSVLGLLGLSVYGVVRRSAAGFAGFFFFLVLLPSSVVPLLRVTSENRMYLPMAAVAGLLAMIPVAAGDRAASRFDLPARTRRMGWVLYAVAALVAVLVLGAAARDRSEIYLNPVRLWEDTLAKSPGNTSALVNLADSLQGAGDLERSRQIYMSALGEAPKSASLRFNFGNLLRRMGQREEALDSYRKALDLDPKFLPATVNMANLLLELERYQEVADRLEKAAALFPDNPAIESNLADAYMELGEPGKAAEQYRKAIASWPDMPQLHYRLALALKRMGDEEGYLDHLTKAVRIRPGFLEAQYNLGNALFREGLYIDAAEHYAMAVRISPGFSDARYNLAAAFLEAGRIEDAAAQLRQVVRLEPENVGAKETLQRLEQVLGEIQNAPPGEFSQPGGPLTGN